MLAVMALALVTRFLARELELVVVTSEGRAATVLPRPEAGRLLVFPGSFDPLHEGHTRLADAAVAAVAARDGGPAPSLIYEISLSNADKGTVTAVAAEKRLAQFAGTGTVALTRRALYVDKSELLGPCDFVVGADTATRILDEKRGPPRPSP